MPTVVSVRLPPASGKHATPYNVTTIPAGKHHRTFLKEKELSFNQNGR
jgi:hypothetical protein